MTELNLDQFDKAGEALDGVLAGVSPEQFDSPTPCGEWTVRALVNHVVHGNLMFVGLVHGSGPVDGSVDHLGDDPLGAFRASLADLRAAFSAEGIGERVFQTPFGERPAPRLVTTRVVETSLHGWDLAKATGQTIDLDAEVVETAFAALKAMLPEDRTGMPFGSRQPVAPDASPVDQLAAFAGRSLN
ncbi:MAG: TIGR03086 family metal-binding protein [Umezawaea sp.]